MKKVSMSIGYFILCLFIPAKGISADFFVSSPAAFQTALNTAIDNNQADTINVAAGTYNLTTTLIYDLTPETNDEQYPLTIVGAGAATTILDGSGTVQLMMLDCTSGTFGTVPSDANCDITIQGISFQNGYTDGSGGGLYFSAFEADLTVEDCSFIGNEAYWDAGGLLTGTWADITVRNTLFQSNESAGSGSGAYISAGSYQGGNALIENSTFSENYSSYEGDGGGACVFSDTVTINGNTFENNILDSYYSEGGAGLFADAIVSVVVTNNSFTGNDSYYGAGGAYVESNGSAIVTGNQFTANVGTYGGGLQLDFYTSLTFNKNVFSNNSSQDAAGAYVSSESTGTANIVNNVFTNNTATSDYANAGGLYLYTNYSPSSIVLTNNTITGNTVSGLGGEYNGKGGGIYLRTSNNDTAVSIYNNIVWGNSAVEEGDDIYINDDLDGDSTGSIIRLYNNDFTDIFIADGDHLSQGDNIDSNPNFVDAANNDIHLLNDSPCLDVGNDTAPGIPATDYEEDVRIIHAHVDIGADEYEGDLSSRFPWLMFLPATITNRE